jgi:type IV secretory pathway VirB2 component (pilin)
MGGIFGKPTTLKVDSVNESINKSVLKLSSNTSINNDVTQYIEASGGSAISNVTQYADTKANMSSVLTATQNSDFMDTLKSDVGQELESKSVAFLGAFDSIFQNKNIDLTTNVNNKIESLNMVELAPICATNNDITQSVIAKSGSSISNVSQTAKSEFIQQCTSLVESNMASMSDIANSINQRAKIVSENPLNFLSDMFKSGTTMVIVIIIVIIGGFVLLIGPGKLDANSIIRDSIKSSKEAAIEIAKITPQGRVATIASSIAPK